MSEKQTERIEVQEPQPLRVAEHILEHEALGLDQRIKDIVFRFSPRSGSGGAGGAGFTIGDGVAGGTPFSPLMVDGSGNVSNTGPNGNSALWPGDTAGEGAFIFKPTAATSDGTFFIEPGSAGGVTNTGQYTAMDVNLNLADITYVSPGFTDANVQGMRVSMNSLGVTDPGGAEPAFVGYRYDATTSASDAATISYIGQIFNLDDSAGAGLMNFARGVVGDQQITDFLVGTDGQYFAIDPFTGLGQDMTFSAGPELAAGATDGGDVNVISGFASGSGSNGVVRIGVGGFGGFIPDGEILNVTTTGGAGGGLTTILDGGKLEFDGGTSGTVDISAPATVTSYSLVLPTAQATSAGQVLSNDGSGTLSWSSSAVVLAIGDAITGGTANRILFEDSSNTLAESTNLRWDDSTDTFTLISAPGNGTLAFDKSNGTVAAPTVVADNDDLGVIDVNGYDGDTYETAAQITFRVDGTVADGIVPGEIIFSTTDDAGSVTQGMAIYADQHISMGLAGYSATDNLNIVYDSTATSGSERGAQLTFTANPSGVSTGTYNTLDITSRSDAASTVALGTLNGIIMGVTHQGTGTADVVRGAHVQPALNNALGTVTTMEGHFVPMVNDGQVDDYTGMFIQAPSGAGTTTISRGIVIGNLAANNTVTTQVALQIEEQSGASSNNTAMNVLGGNVFFNSNSGDYDFSINSDTISPIFFVNSGLNRIGIGTAGPDELLEVNGGNLKIQSTSEPTATIWADGTNANLEYRVFGTGVGSFITHRRSRGTEAAPTIVADLDDLGTYNFTAWDGDQYRTSSQIRVVVDGTPADNIIPSKMIFATGDTAGATTDNFIIDNEAHAIFSKNTGDPAANAGLSSSYVFDDTSGTTNSFQGLMFAGPGAASTAIYQAGDFQTRMDGGDNSNVGSLIGVNANATNSGTGTADFVFGIQVSAQNETTGTNTTQRAIQVFNTNSSTGTVTNATGVFIAPVSNASGTVTTNNGINIEDQGSSVTSGTALHIQDQTDKALVIRGGTITLPADETTDTAPSDDTTVKNFSIQKLAAPPSNAAYIAFSNNPGTDVFYLVLEEG